MSSGATAGMPSACCSGEPAPLVSAVLTEKLHRLLGEQPAQTTAGEVSLLPVNVGAAVFPRDGMSAGRADARGGSSVEKAGKRGKREAGKRVSG